ncbi:hypothetical protein PCASD_03907 [Puccinia coronata f. sp. avenae]|uniref:Uncharacterized protein n=1 Tax=Puccinia coronata f. sp. avenae TaxID=200324 RepID=A0A2N5VAT1_9BASI|nr:hypothetical protein PCASD_03907 [Puccinia coronata f. sp. avenae]
MRRKGFCSGLCYDLAVRANTFQCNMRENFNLYTGIKNTNTQNRTNNNGTHDTKSKGAGQQSYKQGRNQWEPYPNDQETNNQEEDSYQGRNGGEGLGTQYRD